MKRGLLLVFILCIGKDLLLTTVLRKQGFAIADSTSKNMNKNTTTALLSNSTKATVSNTMEPDQNKTRISFLPTSAMTKVTNTVEPDEEKIMTSLLPTSTTTKIANTMEHDDNKTMTSLKPTTTMVKVTNTIESEQDQPMTSLVPTSTMTKITNTMEPDEDKTMTSLLPSFTQAMLTNTMGSEQDKSVTSLLPTSTMKKVSITMEPDENKTTTSFNPTSTMVKVTNTMESEQDKPMTSLLPTSTMEKVTNTMEPDQGKTRTDLLPSSTMKNVSNTIVFQTKTVVNFPNSSRMNVYPTTIQATPTKIVKKSTNLNSGNTARISLMKSSLVIFPSRTSTMQSSSSSMFVVKTTPESDNLLILDVSVKYDREFNDNLRNKESMEFLILKKDVEAKITLAYKNNKNFISVTITGFIRGSIICEGRLYFRNSTNDDIPSLKKTLQDYGADNGFTVENIRQVDDDNNDDDDDDVILGLDWWQIGVIIGGAVAFILLITVIALCCKIARMKKKQIGGNSSHISSAYYDSINEHEEMKSLRASPSKVKSTPKGTDVESGQRNVNMYSTSSLITARNDGLVNETSSKVAKDNDGADVDEDDYVSIIDSFPGAGDVVKL